MLTTHDLSLTYSEVVAACGRVRNRANEAACYLGIRETYPAKPETLAEARVLLNDLRNVRFDLHGKALAREAALASGECRAEVKLAA